MIIIYATAVLCADKILENGWCKSSSLSVNPFVLVFCMAAIPELRLFFIGIMLYMSVKTPEDFEKWMAELDERK